jgi:sulfate transport system permease protein
MAIGFLGLFLVLPLIAVFTEALRRGVGAFLATFIDSDAWMAIVLTLLVAAIAVPLNLAFGVSVAWAVNKFAFPGKSLLVTLMTCRSRFLRSCQAWSTCCCSAPRGCSGVCSTGWDFKILFALPGIILATMFVTFPFIARELIPLMQEQGTVDEEAALTLGASGFHTFFTVTLPNVRWALLYRVLLCNARAMRRVWHGVGRVWSYPRPHQEAAGGDPLQ